MTRTLQRLAPLLALAGLATASPEAAAQTVCVYDPAGRTGFAYGWLQKWQEASAGWGATVELKSYNDEETAVNEEATINEDVATIKAGNAELVNAVAEATDQRKVEHA